MHVSSICAIQKTQMENRNEKSINPIKHEWRKKKTFEIYTYNIQTCSVKKKDSLHSEQNENVRKKRTRIDEKKVFSIRKCLWKALHTEEEKINKTEKYFREKNIYTCIYI